MNFLAKIADNKIYKTVMPLLYGWGASLVILGALFKILYLPNADLMLMIGMGTEAVIFFFSAFEKETCKPIEISRVTNSPPILIVSAKIICFFQNIEILLDPPPRSMQAAPNSFSSSTKAESAATYEEEAIPANSKSHLFIQ